MPIIELPDYTKGFEEFYSACAMMLGYMFFPDDTSSRLNYTMSILAGGGKQIVLDAINNENNADTLRELGTRMHYFSNVDRLNMFVPLTETRIVRGCMAGDILSYSIQIFHDERIREPSLTKAKAIVRHKYAVCKTNSAEKAKRSEIGDVWLNYKDVSHFWYAWREIQGYSKEDQLANPCPVYQNFPLFIGIAESARKIGQVLRAKRQPSRQSTSGFILDRETTYTLPERYTIPIVTCPEIPSLDDWSMEILKASHKRC